MIFNNLYLGGAGAGYVAGTTDGIVTRGGVPSALEIIIMNATDLQVIQRTQSLKMGNYLIMGLDPSKRYLIMARDHDGEYEPFCWDWVAPMSDKTAIEQMELWQSWQT